MTTLHHSISCPPLLILRPRRALRSLLLSRYLLLSVYCEHGLEREAMNGELKTDAAKATWRYSGAGETISILRNRRDSCP